MRATRYRPIRGTGGAIVAGHPLAVAAGARILDRGGNAVDAAVATAAAVAVVRPHMCGVAGDGFFLIYDAPSRGVSALNAGGPAPAAVGLERFPRGVPDRGPLLSTVPGILDGWAQALERFGTLSWADVLQPAVELADRGFPMYESLSAWIAKYRDKYAANPAAAALLLPGGRPPVPGTVFRQRDLARTLRRLARDGARDFYDGDLAAAFVHGLGELGGVMTPDDLASYGATWGEPVRGAYRGHAIHTQPPMSQGWMLAQVLSALDGVELRDAGYDAPDRVLALAGAIRQAFEDRDRWFGDPPSTGFTLERVLSSGRLDEIRAGLARRPAAPAFGERAGDTTALSVVDASGNAVSMIQSLWTDAGIVIPGTGIIVNGRLNSASARPDHPDAIAGGKTPVYTLHTYMATRDGALVALGGTPGGHSQVQTNVQVLSNLLDFGFSPQEAVEAPRFLVGGALHYESLSAMFVEGRLSERTRAALREAGYDVTVLPDWAELSVEGASPVTTGSAKMIGIDPVTGVRSLGIDPRREAHGFVG
jgi:gamma-glutamyltranspeptidase/glutathione hydrolase